MLSEHLVAPKGAVVCFDGKPVSLLAAGVFGHSFRSFTDGVFRQFTGEKQSDGGLDLAGTDG